MADIKQMSFILLVLLVSVSAVYEWAQTEEVIAENINFGSATDFTSGTITGDLNSLQISSSELIETVVRTDFFNFISALQTFFGTIWSVFMKLMFGWVDLVNAIFASVELEFISIVFTTPIAIIQMFAAFYFLRDIVNTVRGVG